MFCQRCGQPLKEGQAFCSLCGYESGFNKNILIAPQTDPDDQNNKGLNVIAFVLPIFGLIYYLCNRKEKPIEAHGVGKWGLIGFISWIVFYIVFFVVIFAIVFGFAFSTIEWNDGSTITMMLNNLICNVR